MRGEKGKHLYPGFYFGAAVLMAGEENTTAKFGLFPPQTHLFRWVLACNWVSLLVCVWPDLQVGDGLGFFFVSFCID